MVDLRSDTVTRPSAAMRDAMSAAPVGDDVFGDDPTVNELQHRVAALLGKAAALYVPSGTMANQLALRCQTQHGDEVILHAKSHIYNYESAGAAALSGVQARPLDSSDGALDPAAIIAAVHDGADPHLAPTRLVCTENTHNGCGGVVVPAQNAAAIGAVARPRGLRMHLDGARLFNAAVASGSAPSALAAEFDTVSVCFSKGLGAPIGSVLAGDAVALSRAHRFRKMFGGGMRQAGVVAAAALFALDHNVQRLADDHRRARTLADELAALPDVQPHYGPASTNLVYFSLSPGHPLAEPDDRGAPRLVARLAARGVLITGSPSRLRAVTHLDVDDDALGHAVAAFRAELGGVGG
ncbi:MAG: low-specificity L-threonine aldolase [Myxococcales bacterium]|nr:low-specificity L-threonine aldolase [Myxococcales bacterium]MCB9530217.1 low-specificity L-threonine aldolase [Myxococcales bacterium]MCB9533730.1 low-specificity L-threonine aldolase [Myxococcales bacterium]